jgi:hypothetical protein
MSLQEDLALGYGRNAEYIKKHVEGLTQADTVKQPPFNANCMNWVLGHVIGSRDGVLKMLGKKGLLTEAQAKRYGYGSAPVCADGPDLLKLEDAIKLLDKGQTKLAAALKAATAEDLAKPMKTFLGDTTLGTMLVVMYGHDSNHVGQAEMLRELALKK